MHVELLVYPRLVNRDDIPLLSSRWQGDVTVQRWIMPDPFLVSGAREYRYGDTMNSIHWKATARSQRLQVYNREFTADPRLLIVVNSQVTETMWDAVTDPELVEKALSYAATLAEHAVSRGVPVGFGYNGWLLNHQGFPFTARLKAAGGIWSIFFKQWRSSRSLVPAPVRTFSITASRWKGKLWISSC